MLKHRVKFRGELHGPQVQEVDFADAAVDHAVGFVEGDVFEAVFFPVTENAEDFFAGAEFGGV